MKRNKTERELSEYIRRNIVVSQSGCWLWQGYLVRGYGVIMHNGIKDYVHRISFRLFAGVVPGGLCVLHKCDNPQCVNPDHLFLGTKAVNNRDKCQKGRAHTPSGADHYYHKFPDKKPIGEKNGRALLTEKDVIEIRNRTDKKAKDLAIEYGVRAITVREAKSGRTWAHIKNEQ